MLAHYRDRDSIESTNDPCVLQTSPTALAPQPARQATDDELMAAVDYILADSFFSVGQGVHDRKTVSHAAVIWWCDRYRAKFFRTMQRFGNRWLVDRGRVAAMCRMLGDRAVHYAGDNPEIDLQSAMRAATDVEQFCVKHAQRRSRRLLGVEHDDHPEMFAGYWCTL